MKHHHRTTTDSTSRLARALADEHPGETLLVSADAQTEGRGRTARPWHSPSGGAWFSLVWPPTQPADRYQALPLVVGLAVLETLESAVRDAAPDAAPRLTLKWPNDVLLDGRKVAGVLCEQMLPWEATASLIIGVGVNVNFGAGDLPSDLRYPATTLADAAGARFDVPALIRAAADRIAAAVAQLEADGFTDDLRYRIEARLAQLDAETSLELHDQTVTGTIRGIGSAGELKLDTEGQVRLLRSGEVIAARPAEPA